MGPLKQHPQNGPLNCGSRETPNVFLRIPQSVHIRDPGRMFELSHLKGDGPMPKKGGATRHVGDVCFRASRDSLIFLGPPNFDTHAAKRFPARPWTNAPNRAIPETLCRVAGTPPQLPWCTKTPAKTRARTTPLQASRAVARFFPPSFLNTTYGVAGTREPGAWRGVESLFKGAATNISARIETFPQN